MASQHGILIRFLISKASLSSVSSCEETGYTGTFTSFEWSLNVDFCLTVNMYKGF